jgi:hypothetical protein
MNRLKLVLTGVLSGVAITSATSILMIAGRQLVYTEQLPLAVGTPEAGVVIGSSIPIGAITGALIVCLIRHFSQLESVLLAILASVALGSLAVMAGGYANDSLMPLVIYGVAVLNGLLLVPVCEATSRLTKPDQINRLHG